MSLHRMRSNGNKRVNPFPTSPSRERSRLKPYRIWLKAFPKYPYVGIVWARSMTEGKRKLALYFKKHNYRLQRSSPSSYHGVELTPEFARRQKSTICIGEKEL